MTNKQVEFILSLLDADDAATNYNPLLNNFMIVVSKDQKLYTDINMYRYKFDLTNGLLERIRVSLYSTSAQKLPSHNNYDSYTINGVTNVYEYIMDGDNNIVKDIFDISKIIMFVPTNVSTEIVDAVSESESSFTVNNVKNIKIMFDDFGYSNIDSEWIALPDFARINLSNNSSLWRASGERYKYKIDTKRELLYVAKYTDSGEELGVNGIIDFDLIIGIETRNAISAQYFAGYDI
jgi:hypothetical protein